MARLLGKLIDSYTYHLVLKSSYVRTEKTRKRGAFILVMVYTAQFFFSMGGFNSYVVWLRDPGNATSLSF
jgi:hypothetical protein